MRESSTIKNDVAAVILAGGKAKRMQGTDKGLITLKGKPMITYVINALNTQLDEIFINANRNKQQYQELGYPVISDLTDDYLGPLAGILSGLKATKKEFLLVVPCDSPNLSDTILIELYNNIKQNKADIAVAHDGNRMHPVFALIKKTLINSLNEYLADGGRKIDEWYFLNNYCVVRFTDSHEMFNNINSPKDLEAHKVV